MAFCLMPACTSDLSITSDSNDIVIYPSPPDITRIQYLTSISMSTDIVGSQSAINRFMFGETTPKPVSKPYGITANKSKIYVCDTGAGALIIIDLIEGNFNLFAPSGRGELQLPLNCSVDENGDVYVADGNRRQIVVFNSEGKYVKEFGENHESFKPTDVVVAGNKIVVVSVSDQKIFIYDKSTHVLLDSFPDLEQGDDGYLYQPTSICVNDDSVYVSDMGDSKVKLYSLSGKYITSFGAYGNYPGQLMRPKGVAVDKQLNLYVADAAFENVQIFDREGSILMSFGGPYKRKGDMYLPADVTISYSGLDYFRKYVDDSFDLKYLIFVTNQYGPDKISVYGFVGSLN